MLVTVGLTLFLALGVNHIQATSFAERDPLRQHKVAISGTASPHRRVAVNGVLPGFPTLTFSPANPVISVQNGSILETIIISATQPTDTVILLSSSNAQAWPVPASVTIPAGALSVSFTLTARFPSASTITATLPPSLGSGNFTTRAGTTFVPPEITPFVVPTPTLSEWGLIALALGLAILGVKRLT